MTFARASTAIATELSRYFPLLSPSALPSPLSHICISRSSSTPPPSLILRPFSPHRSIASSSSSSPSASSMASSLPSSIYDITVKDVKGNDVSLSAYKGKVLLIVNVASQCGLTTTNYTELTDIYSKYKDQGLEILAFPCNQFAGQEPGSNEEIQQFACTRFKAEYPIFDKVDVNGGKTAPIYQYLKKAKGGGVFGDFVKWNFTKFLVSRDGEVVQRFAPTTAPSKIEDDIKKVLRAS